MHVSSLARRHQRPIRLSTAQTTTRSLSGSLAHAEVTLKPTGQRRRWGYQILERARSFGRCVDARVVSEVQWDAPLGCDALDLFLRQCRRENCAKSLTSSTRPKFAHPASATFNMPRRVGSLIIFLVLFATKVVVGRFVSRPDL